MKQILVHHVLPIVQRVRDRQVGAFTILALACFLTSIFILIVTSIPRNSPLVIIEAETEILSYTVARQELAAIPVNRAKIRGEIEDECRNVLRDDGSFTGLVSPKAGVQVIYRVIAGQVLVELRPSSQSAASLGILESVNGARCSIDERIVVSFRSNLTARTNLRPLPIAGPAVLGKELSAPEIGESERSSPGLLLSASIHVLGRASFPTGNHALYPAVDEKIIVPAGSRLVSISNDSEDTSLPRSWYGIVSFEKDVLKVSATTDGEHLRLFRPGSSGDAERFNTSILAQIFNDPSLAIVSLGLVVFTIVFQTLLGLLSVPRASRREQATPVSSASKSIPKEGSEPGLAEAPRLGNVADKTGATPKPVPTKAGTDFM